MNDPNVLPLFRPPTRIDCVDAVRRALLRVRFDGWTCDALGREIGVTGETISNYCKDDNNTMLGGEPLSLLLYKFPAARPFLMALWGMGVVAEPTPDERIEQVHKHLEALRREIPA